MGKRIFIYVFWLLLFCMMSGQVIGQNKSVESHSHTCKTVLALKNNLLYDLALAPNMTADVISAISSFREGQRRVTGWETAIRAEDCPDTSWEHMPKEVPMIFS